MRFPSVLRISAPARFFWPSPLGRRPRVKRIPSRPIPCGLDPVLCSQGMPSARPGRFFFSCIFIRRVAAFWFSLHALRLAFPLTIEPFGEFLPMLSVSGFCACGFRKAALLCRILLSFFGYLLQDVLLVFLLTRNQDLLELAVVTFRAAWTPRYEVQSRFDAGGFFALESSSFWQVSPPNWFQPAGLWYRVRMSSFDLKPARINPLGDFHFPFPF